jgi:hypothetical protein
MAALLSENSSYVSVLFIPVTLAVAVRGNPLDLCLFTSDETSMNLRSYANPLHPSEVTVISQCRGQIYSHDTIVAA